MTYSESAMQVNDFLSGAAALVFTSWWMRSGKATGRWLIATLGVWLLLAPIALWASAISTCLNTMMSGTFLITAAAIIPTVQESVEDRGVLPEWSYNPSAWSQRIPISVLAFAGFLMSGYLATFQLGYINRAYDPFFADNTQRVLTSDISRWFPISDAGLGAFSYQLEALTGLVEIGDASEQCRGSSYYSR